MESEPDIERLKSKINFGLKGWLKFEDKDVLGTGWAELLENIERNAEGSLAQAASQCTQKRKDGYSYKYAWNILKRIEERTGQSPVLTGKGGKGGGGWVKLNAWGKFLLNEYRSFSKELEKIKETLKKS